MDKEAYEFQAVHESLRNDEVVKAIREIISLPDKYDTEWQRMIATATLIDKIISSIDPDVGLMCSSIIKSIREIIGLSDKYDTEWQRMIAIATLIGKIISSIDPDSELICDNLISSINYELQKPIKDDIKAEVIKTMSDDFDPGKASEITFKHFEKAYPGFEQFCKEQYGEE